MTTRSVRWSGALLVLLSACGGGGGGAGDAAVEVDSSTAVVDAAVDGEVADGGPSIDATVPDGSLSSDGSGGNVQLVFDRASYDFMGVISGTTSAPATVMLSNTGTQAAGVVTLGKSGAAASDFLVAGNGCSNLAPAASCQVTIVFTPTSEGSKAVTIEAGSGGATASLLVFGTGSPRQAQLTITPTSQAFGNIVAGQLSAPFTFRVENTGVIATGALAIQIGGANAGDWVYAVPVGADCSAAALAPGARCDVRLRFGPASAGARAATLEVSASPGGSVTSTLSGAGENAGAAVLTLSPTGNQDLGTLPAGASGSPVTFTVTNTGQALSGTIAVTVAGPNAARFVKSNDQCQGQTLAAGGSCALQLAFAPDVAGAASATLTVAANPGGLLTSMLAATGTASLTVTPSGSGSVASSPGGIACPGTCSATFNQNPVTLTATPAGGFAFSGWGGACAGALLTCTVTMNSARTVTAMFVPLRTLTVATTGMGSVSSNLGGIACPGSCQANVNQGTPVTLTALAGSGARFGGWSEPSCTTPVCTVTMDSDRAVTATFIAQHLLTVANVNTGVGSGSVVIAPIGDSTSTCVNPSCTRLLDQATVVNLTAMVGADSSFLGWTGDCAAAGTTPTCQVTMTQARTLGARFEAFNLGLTVVGSGTITYSSPLLTCAPSCNKNYPTGTAVTLTPNPTAGFAFSGWSGDCAGFDTCALTMNQAHAATATFAAARTLSLTVGNNGDVVSTGGVIDCTGSCTTRSREFGDGVVLTLTAQPGPGHSATWTGACAGAVGNTCMVTMTANLTVGVSFPTGANLSAGSGPSCGFQAGAGGSLSCAITVYNTGTASTGAGFSIRLQIDNGMSTTIATCAVPALAAGQNTTVTCVGSVAVGQALGSYTPRVDVDSQGEIDETDEGNNSRSGNSVFIHAASGLDLRGEALACPTVVSVGGLASCTVEVRNWGGATVPASTTTIRLSGDTTYTLADPAMATCATPALAPGAVVFLACSGTVPVVSAQTGAHAFLSADDPGLHDEGANEGNNLGPDDLVAVVRPGGPDLVPSVTCSPERGAPGSFTVTCTLSVTNLGDAAAGASASRVAFSSDDVFDAGDYQCLLGTGALAPGATASTACSVSGPSGPWTLNDYRIFAVADFGAVVTEIDEANNVRLTDSLVVGPDLAEGATAMTCTKTVLGTPDSTTCTVSVRNRGGVNIASGWNVYIQLSTDATITLADTGVAYCGAGPGLTAGQSGTYSCTANIPGTITPGSYFLGMILDVDTEIAEASEANNVVTPLAVQLN